MRSQNENVSFLRGQQLQNTLSSCLGPPFFFSAKYSHRLRLRHVLLQVDYAIKWKIGFQIEPFVNLAVFFVPLHV